MLDDLDQISKIDKHNMFSDLESFPDQITSSKDFVEKSNLSSIFKVDNIVISGMGASAISGDILQSLLRDKINIPIYVTRQYDLPKWVHKNTLVISQSYSGNTEETLSTFKNAYQKRCKIISISSNGKLKEYSEKRQIPFIKIPENIQPRAATGYILFSSIYTLQKTGILSKDIDSEIKDTLSIIKESKNKFKTDTTEKENPAKQYAKQIQGLIPQIYGWNIYYPIAKRWSTQINENSKLVCKYDEVSECNHNDIVGWSSNPEVTKKFVCILFRDHEEESIYLTTRLNFMKKLYSDVAGKVIEIPVQGKKRLAKMMYSMYLGDYVSCYLAVLRNIDPSPVVAISELKEELAKL